ncbi:MAG: pyrroline-5-carboxylate reductase [Ottowia sp.]|nr:pyrroline-5-carboxylate reductase [Ottowia sp.]
MTQQPTLDASTRLAVIGGGNMATAIMGGVLRQGLPASQIRVVEPLDAARQALQEQLGVAAQSVAGAFLADADLVLWAVKPQVFAEAAAPAAAHVAQAVQLSIMAGVRVAAIEAVTGSRRVVRCMPNTPALIGQGMTALFATAAVDGTGRGLSEAVMRCAGDTLWVEEEAQLDAVTALSGSGPAYVFYFLEAMQQAGVELGLSAGQSRLLATQTFAGAAALAADSDDPLATLRERVTSKGGTTFAALERMRQDGVGEAFVRAMKAAHARALELGGGPGR